MNYSLNVDDYDVEVDLDKGEMCELFVKGLSDDELFDFFYDCLKETYQTTDRELIKQNLNNDYKNEKFSDQIIDYVIDFDFIDLIMENLEENGYLEDYIKGDEYYAKEIGEYIEDNYNVDEIDELDD